jgi:hypothetical protein
METNKKKITLFKNVSDNPKAPVLTGFISQDNKKILKISLWSKKSETNLEYYSGECSEIDLLNES